MLIEKDVIKGINLITQFTLRQGAFHPVFTKHPVSKDVKGQLWERKKLKFV